MLICPACASAISLPNVEETKLRCSGCKRCFEKSVTGVWDFRLEEDQSKSLAVYNEPEFKRWLDIFGKIETKNWKIYETKLNRFFSQAGHRFLGRALKDALEPHSQIIEIGAGTGELLNFITIENYIAIDTNWEALVQLMENHPDSIAICTSGGRLPIHNEYADVVISLHTLEHIYYLAEFFEEASRILKSDGHQYFVIPCEGGLPFYLGRMLVTGPHLRKKYNLDVKFVMDREHINDANRVKKFLRMYFKNLTFRYWPLPFLPFLNANVMIWGCCQKREIIQTIDSQTSDKK